MTLPDAQNDGKKQHDHELQEFNARGLYSLASLRAAEEIMLTQPLQLEQEPALQLICYHHGSQGREQAWFCIPLLQCIHIQKILVAHWQALNQLHGPGHPIISFSDSENISLLLFSQDEHHWDPEYHSNKHDEQK